MILLGQKYSYKPRFPPHYANLPALLFNCTMLIFKLHYIKRTEKLFDLITYYATELTNTPSSPKSERNLIRKLLSLCNGYAYTYRTMFGAMIPVPSTYPYLQPIQNIHQICSVEQSSHKSYSENHTDGR